MASNTGKSTDQTSSMGMITLLFSSVLAASANTLLFKIALNAFSSPTTNYGFFVSQFSTLLYTAQALFVSVVLYFRDPSSLNMSLPMQSVYLYMGGLDAASATLGAIAGAYCPGEMQTILNQMIIPMTMLGAAIFLGATFAGHQVWGSALILFGAGIASADYFFRPSLDDVSSTGGMAFTTTIALYFMSIVPSALSNIYKERKLKELDMNEVHTSTIVSFWQLLIGFVFLPLMALPALGGLTSAQMASQLSDGFSCFMGTNPNDPNDDCSNSAVILLVYILLNFMYNIMMLAITKRGSAVLLVMSQALSLPITNIAFTLKPLMGDDAEPLTITDLAGLVLVCIGFLAYSGFGFAKNFMVAQGPPGQMAYAHFEDHDEVIVSTKLGTNPQELADFILGSVVKTHADKQLKFTSGRDDDIGDGDAAGLLDVQTAGIAADEDLGPLDANRAALEVLRETTELVEKHIRSLELMIERGEGGAESSAISTPEIMKRFKAVTGRPPSQGTTARTSPGRTIATEGYGSIDRSKVIEMPLV